MAFSGLSEKINSVFARLRSKGRLTEADIKEAMREVRRALLEADVNFKVVRDFVEKVSTRAVGTQVLEALSPAQQVIKIVNEELTELLGGKEEKIHIASKPPTIIMFVGLQGSGKTTNIAKLAGYFKKQGKRPLLVACDIYRPAAIDQLKVVGGQVGVPVFEMGKDDPVKIVKAALSHAMEHSNDMVFIDTAGRLHVDTELMDELRRIKSEIDVTETILAVDAMTGQDAVNAASAFNDSVGIDGVLLTKTDSDSRGGAALSVKAVTGKPIKFIGTGEKLSDIEVFHPDRMASRILGMGDMLSLIEKAEAAFDEKKAAEMAEKLRKNKFTLTDFYDQLIQVQNMGDMSDILAMLPGANKALKNVQVDPKQLTRTAAIIQSMTPYERENPGILNFNRKKRIAAGCGLKVEDVNRLLKQYEATAKMAKQFSGANMKKLRRGGFPGLF